MIGFLSGCLSFLLFILYDLGQAGLFITNWRGMARSFFLLGFLILTGCTAGLAWQQMIQLAAWEPKQMIALFAAALFFVMLIYTLFFALPFEETYVTQTAGAKTYDRGMYALCRHPGVLWFAGFYISLWLTLGGASLFWLAFWYSLFNVGYVILQDICTFPRIFVDYEQYKQRVPFLLPNYTSLKRCILTLRKAGA